MELTKEMIGTAKPKVEKVDLSEWYDGEIITYVRHIKSGFVVDAPADDDRDPREVTMETCAAGLCDSSGEPMFTNGDCSALREMPFKALEHVAETIMAFNGMAEGAAEKNSPDPDDVPPSG